MKKPEKWYGFKTQCDLYMCPFDVPTESNKQQYCKRADRYGKLRSEYNLLKCHWNICPKLKE